MTSALLIAFLALAALLAATLFFSWRAYAAARSPRADDAALRLLQQQLESLRAQVSDSLSGQTQQVNQQLNQITSQVGKRLEEVSRSVSESQKSVGDRLDNAARVVGEVQKSLGTLGEASSRIFEVGKDIAGLQDLLRSPKLRGGLGEFFLADLLGQILPAKHFKTQYSFKSGDKVDAVILLGGKYVPVDSKFPLEEFRKILEAKTDEERRPLKRKFVSDVKKHIDAIADKYILPDEDTYEFAMMYIPAENVYYEVIVKDEPSESDKSLTDYALARRVIPVSPNSFYAYLQAISMGLRGFEIEQNARVIMQNLARLKGDFDRFRDDFEVLGKHVSSAKGKYEDAEKRLGRFQDKLVSVSQSGDPALPGEPALPPLPASK